MRNTQISQEGTERPEYSSTLHKQVFDAVMSQLTYGTTYLFTDNLIFNHRHL